MTLLKKNRNRSLFALAFLACRLAATTLANPVIAPGTWVDISPAGIDKSSLNTMISQGLAIDPTNPSVLWWCNGPYSGGGLYKSTDGGSNWTKIPPFDNPLHIRINPKDRNQMYLCDGVRGSTGGFWKSTDGGSSWVQPQGYVNTTNDTVVGTGDLYEIQADPSDFNHVIVSYHGWWKATNNSSGVLESTDGGSDWISHMPASGMTSRFFGLLFVLSGTRYRRQEHLDYRMSRWWLLAHLECRRFVDRSL